MGKQSDILSAASNGDIKIFSKLIAEDHNLIYAVDENGNTVLHNACYSSKTADLAKQIINKYQFLVNKTNNDGCKPIYIAAYYGNADVFWYFVDKEESLIDAVEENGYTNLHSASIDTNTTDLSKQITEKYPHLLNKPNKNGLKPIHTATQYGNADIFWYFIDKDKCLIDAVDKDGDTVLHYASQSSKASNLAKEIVDKYPYLTHKKNIAGCKPIHNAAEYGNADVFWYFIDKDLFNCLIDAVDKDGYTVLHYACVKSNADDLAKTITKKYPHLLHKTDKNGQKPIHIAVSNKNTNVFWYFIDKDKSLIDAIDKNGDTVLHLASGQSDDNVNFAKQIAKKYPHLMHKADNCGCKPIHYAAQYGNASVFWFFIDKDKSLINSVDNKGNTVLHYGYMKTDFAIKIMKKYSHFLHYTNNNGELPIHYAAQNGNADVFWCFVHKDKSLIDAIDKDGDTVLHRACMKFDAPDLAKQITDKYLHLIDKTNNDGLKPIHFAVYHNANVFWYFIDKDKCLIDAVDKNGDTVLHIACMKFDAPDLAIQIADNYPHLVNKTNKYGCKPIHTAAYHGNASVFWYFINKDKSLIDAVDKDDETVLHYASKSSKTIDLAKQITDIHPHLVNKTDNNGRKPIHIAAYYGNADIFWYFIDKDESLIDAVDKDGRTILHKACDHANDLAIEITDIHSHLIIKKDNDGVLPIHVAAENGNADIFWHFVDKDKSLIDAVDKDDETVLHKASIKSDAVDLAKQITDKYPHLLNKSNKKGTKPIHTAAENGNADVFWSFIDKDKNLKDATDETGYTILHYAMLNFKTVNLAKKIANKYPHLIHKTDNYGRKPIHIAAENGNADVFWCFIHKDISLIDAVDKDGRTVLHRAIRSTELGAVDLAKEIARKYPHLVKIKDNEGRKL